MKRRLTTQDITWFLELNGNGRLDLDPTYQRKSVWTRKDRQYFLDTIFNNYPSPAIFLHKDLDPSGSATYHVVDGKQRLETILLFLDNKIRVPESFGDIRLDNKRWKDLTDDLELKTAFWDYQFTVEMLDSIEPSVVNDVFGRLNQNSRKLLPQEIRHSRYDGWFITFVENEVNRPVWKSLKITSVARSRRMADVQFVSELMSIVLLGEVKGFDQDELNNLYARFDDPEEADETFDPDAFTTRFDKLVEYMGEVESCNNALTASGGGFSHLYTFFAWLALHSENQSAQDVAQTYARFMRAVAATNQGEPFDDEFDLIYRENIDLYISNSRGASTDRPQRAARLEALRNVFSTSAGS